MLDPKKPKPWLSMLRLSFLWIIWGIPSFYETSISVFPKPKGDHHDAFGCKEYAVFFSREDGEDDQEQ